MEITREVWIASEGDAVATRQKITNRNNQPIKLVDLSKGFPNISINTIKKDLLYLRTEKMIDSIGKNRGTIYVAIDNK